MKTEVITPQSSLLPACQGGRAILSGASGPSPPSPSRRPLAVALGLHSAQWAPGALTALPPCEELGHKPASLQLHRSPSRWEALVCPHPRPHPETPPAWSRACPAPAGPKLVSTPPAVTLLDAEPAVGRGPVRVPPPLVPSWCPPHPLSPCWTLSQRWAGLGPPVWQRPLTGALPARVRAQEPCRAGGLWGARYHL